MKKLSILTLVIVSLLLIQSCAVVEQGNVGLKQKFGKIKPDPYQAGLYGLNPFIAKMIKVPLRTMNLEVRLDLPSKEGLTITSVISILYRIEEEKVLKIIEDIGEDYEQSLILPVFRSASSDITANYMAKDMHSGQRSVIEKAIQDRMSEVLLERGFIVEEVLMKSIELPNELSMAIERKLKAEQESMAMEFILEIEKKEAARRRIEAEGNRDAQKILSEGLNDAIIKLRSIEAFRELAKSNNAKVIITDGKAPILIPGN